MSGEVSMPSLRAEHRARAIVQGIRHKRIARSGVLAAVTDAGIDIAFGLIMLLLLGAHLRVAAMWWCPVASVLDAGGLIRALESDVGPHSGRLSLGNILREIFC